MVVRAVTPVSESLGGFVPMCRVLAPTTPDLRVRSSVDGAPRDSDFTQQVDKQ